MKENAERKRTSIRRNPVPLTAWLKKETQSKMGQQQTAHAQWQEDKHLNEEIKILRFLNLIAYIHWTTCSNSFYK